MLRYWRASDGNEAWRSSHPSQRDERTDDGNKRQKVERCPNKFGEIRVWVIAHRLIQYVHGQQNQPPS